MDAQTKQWTKALDDSYAKLPALPKGATDFIVNIAPWLSLIFGVLSILVGVSAFGFLAVLSPFAAVAGAGAYAITGLLSSLVLLVQGVIMIVAFPSLKKRGQRGWNLLFWSLILSVVSSVLSLNVFGVVQSVVGALIGYYFLYQIKSYYK
ncbi:MAG: hypothetical protein UR81_C0016G0015 [Candidatus Levybacteria bacterium GW2011_GWB1_35_5]|nr:MAG: hypothetical protein UR81_C0016G0015 [Candidatus Levybacteria bacterium GW2011_GWB1_35_5]